MRSTRARIVAALAKPLPTDGEHVHSEVFNPWEDVLDGIHGSYASESDVLVITAMEAVSDKTTFDFIGRVGFAGEFMLYVLSGHGMINYGTSPRGGWPDEDVADLWVPLIDKWKAYYEKVWGEPFPDEPEQEADNADRT